MWWHEQLYYSASGTFVQIYTPVFSSSLNCQRLSIIGSRAALHHKTTTTTATHQISSRNLSPVESSTGRCQPVMLQTRTWSSYIRCCIWKKKSSTLSFAEKYVNDRPQHARCWPLIIRYKTVTKGALSTIFTAVVQMQAFRGRRVLLIWVGKIFSRVRMRGFRGF